MGQSDETCHRFRIQQICTGRSMGLPVILTVVNPADGSAGKRFIEVIHFPIMGRFCHQRLSRIPFPFCPHKQPPGSKLPILLNHLAMAGAGRIHGFVIQNDFHIPLRCPLHRVAHIVKIFLCQITDGFRQSQTRMNHKSIHSLVLEFPHLPVQLLLRQFIIPKPKRNGRKFFRWVQKFLF